MKEGRGRERCFAGVSKVKGCGKVLKSVGLMLAKFFASEDTPASKNIVPDLLSYVQGSFPFLF